MFNKRLDNKYSERERDPLVSKYIEDEPANEWILDEDLLQDDELYDSEDEVDTTINSKRKQTSKASTNATKRARTNTIVPVDEVEDEMDLEEGIEEQEGEEEEEANVEEDEDIVELDLDDNDMLEVEKKD